MAAVLLQNYHRDLTEHPQNIIKGEMTSDKNQTETFALPRLSAFYFKTVRNKKTQKRVGVKTYTRTERTRSEGQEGSQRGGSDEEKTGIREKIRGDKVVLYFIIIEENNSSYSRPQDLSLLSSRVPNTELWQQLNFLDI